MGLHPKWDFFHSLDLAEGLGGADDVVDAHAVESLAEEIEATEDVVALAGVSGPCGGTDPARSDVGHGPVLVLEHAFFGTEGLDVVRGKFFRILPTEGLGEGLAVGGGEVAPPFLVEDVEDDEIGVLQGEVLPMGNEQAKLPRLLRVEIVGGEADAVGLQVESLLVAASLPGLLGQPAKTCSLSPAIVARRYFAHAALSLGTGSEARIAERRYRESCS